jgi:predicted dehydrogenase
MASAKIRIGVIGANIHRGWAPRSHLPALVASPEFELTGVCTTRQESAEEAAKLFGARLAFSDYHQMLAHPEIDAVSVVLRVPSHYEPTMAALHAGKHVYTEWPLGRTLAEAQEMADLARARGVRCMVGLQARANPAIMYLKDLVEDGYVGEIMSCRVSILRDGVLQRRSDRTWQRDDALGATTFTIAFGHTVDALRYVVGDFSEVSSVVSTQAHQWYETDTKQHLDVTAPDNVLLSGRLANGAVASVHVASVPYANSDYRMEIYGSEGTLVAAGENTPQMEKLTLQGVNGGGKQLQDLPVPEQYTWVLEGMPQGEAFNVGQMYYQFGQAIRSGQSCSPNFDTAVELHKFLDSVRAASDQGRTIKTGG